MVNVNDESDEAAKESMIFPICRYDDTMLHNSYDDMMFRDFAPICIFHKTYPKFVNLTTESDNAAMPSPNYDSASHNTTAATRSHNSASHNATAA